MFASGSHTFREFQVWIKLKVIRILSMGDFHPFSAFASKILNSYRLRQQKEIAGWWRLRILVSSGKLCRVCQLWIQAIIWNGVHEAVRKPVVDFDFRLKELG